MTNQLLSHPILKSSGRILLIPAITLVALLIVRAWVASQVGFSPLPMAEPLPYHAATVLVVGAASAVAGRLLPGWRAVAVGAASAFLVYLGWAIVQQNLILNPDWWKLWERHWLTVAVMCGVSGLLLSLALSVAADVRQRSRAARPSAS